MLHAFWDRRPLKLAECGGSCYECEQEESIQSSRIAHTLLPPHILINHSKDGDPIILTDFFFFLIHLSVFKQYKIILNLNRPQEKSIWVKMFHNFSGARCGIQQAHICLTGSLFLSFTTECTRRKQRGIRSNMQKVANTKKEKEGNRGRLCCLHELIISELER